ncbi:MAG: hypothetical protein IOMNBAOH_02081 [Rhodocyclaceae bacterium]|nr:hypothetical protein [Rhodocyclaceae bacterium]HMM71428.1 DUF1841 family protein [Rhodocyclaceae bacterium]
MFSPDRDQARAFFVQAWRKRRAGVPEMPLEALAADVIAAHPEYHALLESDDGGIDRKFSVEEGRPNPFLHLSLHLAIEEQLQIDQPTGIVMAFQRLTNRHGFRHAALHAALECLGETLWEAQRSGQAPDGERYLERMNRAAG